MTEQVVDWDMVLGEIKKIYDSVEKLAQQFAGRPFTPDGHLVGSIGEVVASYAFGLTLEKPSNQGADAIHRKSGRSVEVKCTQTKRVSFYDCAPTNNVIVLFIDRDGSFECVFNGLFADLERGLGKKQKNGQRTISIKTLGVLRIDVDQADILELIKPLPRRQS